MIASYVTKLQMKTHLLEGLQNGESRSRYGRIYHLGTRRRLAGGHPTGISESEHYTLCRENVLAVRGHKHLREPLLRQFGSRVMHAREHTSTESEEEEQKQIREHGEDERPNKDDCGFLDL